MSNTVTPLAQLSGKARFEELQAAYKKHFGMQFSNVDGACHTFGSQGFVHPMNESAICYSRIQANKCISEDSFLDLVSVYDAKMSKLSHRERTNQGVRDATVSGLWFMFYMREQRELKAVEKQETERLAKRRARDEARDDEREARDDEREAKRKAKLQAREYAEADEFVETHHRTYFEWQQLTHEYNSMKAEGAWPQKLETISKQIYDTGPWARFDKPFEIQAYEKKLHNAKKTLKRLRKLAVEPSAKRVAPAENAGAAPASGGPGLRPPTTWRVGKDAARD